MSWLASGVFLFYGASWCKVNAFATESAGLIPDLATILQKMSAAQIQIRTEYRPYTVTRDYKLYGKDTQRPRTEVLVDVEYLPPNTKRYEIKRTSGGMGDGVIRRVLDHEVIVTRDPGDAEMSLNNYSFEYLTEDIYEGHRCYVLKSQPKRTDRNLLRAKVWVDADTYRIRRIEGEPQKAPSWWVHDVHLTLQFGEIEGMWLQTATQATAQVRFSGPCHLVSRDLEIQAPVTIMARKSSSPERLVRHRILGSDSVGAFVAK